MKEIISRIENLKQGPIRTLVDKRIDEFRRMRARRDKALFSELCFCILTANFNAERGIRLQKKLYHDFPVISRQGLVKRLKEEGYRFPNVRAHYIVEARKKFPLLKEKLASVDDALELRNWINSSIKGLGFKEASHFLRNIGFTDLAIIDFHIVDILADNGLIERPKTMTPKRYLEIEKKLQEIGRRAGLNMAELDLFLWYLETGKVLK